MKIKIKIIAIAAIALSSSVFGDVSLRGAPSCGNWLKERQIDRSLIGLANKYWLSGYLSGIAITTDKDFITGTDNNSLDLWIDNYCQANPLENLGAAGVLLATKMIQQKKL